MLIEFSVENFLSFRERATLSLLAAPEVDELDGLVENTFPISGGARLLKSTLIYGPNASGKSNIVKAIHFARKFILDSIKETQAGEPIDVTPFILDTQTAEQDSLFEFVWIEEEILYRYGFSVNRARVQKEWLLRAQPDGSSEIALFKREGDQFDISDAFEEGRDVIGKTRDNALFLSAVASWNGAQSIRILGWFRRHIAIISGLQDISLLRFTVEKIDSGVWSEEILNIIRKADLGIMGISASKDVEMPWPDDLPDELRSKLSRRMAAERLQLRHQRFDATGEVAGKVDFDFQVESEGTKKLISLAGPLLDILKNAKVLLFDEFDARLHPRLTHAIVELFNGDTNEKGAQIVAITHDTNLLEPALVRRDQVWFTEKGPQGATRLYSLAEFNLPSDARYQRDYLLGKYGAVPVVGTLIEPEAVK